MIKLFVIDMDFVKASLRGTDVSGGMCSAIAIDFCYNELSGFHCSRVSYELQRYYSDVRRHIPRVSAYQRDLAARKIHGLQIVLSTDGLSAKYIKATENWDVLYTLQPGVYVFNVVLPNGLGRSVALVKREFWVFFNPAAGALLFDRGVDEIVRYMRDFCPVKMVYILSVTKNGDRHGNINPIMSFKCGPL